MRRKRNIALSLTIVGCIALPVARSSAAPLPTFEEIKRLSDPGELTAWGRRYERGVGLVRDTGKAVRLYCMAARRGDAEAKYYLGQVLAFGRGIERDLELAAAWFYEADEQSEPRARSMLILLGVDSKPSRPAVCPSESIARPSVTKQRSENRSIDPAVGEETIKDNALDAKAPGFEVAILLAERGMLFLEVDCTNDLIRAESARVDGKPFDLGMPLPTPWQPSEIATAHCAMLSRSQVTLDQEKEKGVPTPEKMQRAAELDTRADTFTVAIPVRGRGVYTMEVDCTRNMSRAIGATLDGKPFDVGTPFPTPWEPSGIATARCARGTRSE